MIKLDKVPIFRTAPHRRNSEHFHKKLEKVKKGLMNELLTGRKRVKVNMERD